MAKKKKTLDELDLREVISQVGFVSSYIRMYSEDEKTLSITLANKELKEKLFSSISELTNLSSELQKRFNAPCHYSDD